MMISPGTNPSISRFCATVKVQKKKPINILRTMNNTKSGTYTGVLTAVDGHTAKEIPVMEYLVEGKELNFLPSETNIIIKPTNEEDFETPETIKKVDRYEFIYDKSPVASYSDYDEFLVETNSYIDIIENSEYAGHLIIQDGEIDNWKWIDFETEEDYTVTTTRISDKAVKVRVYGYGNNYHFKSIGLVNVVTKTFDVVIRDFNDTDASAFQTALERFRGVTMNPNDRNYIARVIGTTDEEYPRNSLFVTLDMEEGHPTNVVPAGFRGYKQRQVGMSGETAAPMYYKTSYLSGDSVNRTFLGISELAYTGFTSDQVSYSKVISTVEKDFFK